MKHILLITTFLASSLLAFSQQKFETVKDRNGKNMLKGFISDSLLAADSSYNTWYTPNYKGYQAQDSLVQKIKPYKDSVQMVVFMGTWCPDSKFIMPIYFKLLDAIQYNKKNITLIAVDRSKTDDAFLAKNMGVTHVPTIIFYKKEKEISRLVEYGASGNFDTEFIAHLAAAAVVRE